MNTLSTVPDVPKEGHEYEDITVYNTVPPQDSSRAIGKFDITVCPAYATTEGQGSSPSGEVQYEAMDGQENQEQVQSSAAGNVSGEEQVSSPSPAATGPEYEAMDV